MPMLFDQVYCILKSMVMLSAKHTNPTCKIGTDILEQLDIICGQYAKIYKRAKKQNQMQHKLKTLLRAVSNQRTVAWQSELPCWAFPVIRIGVSMTICTIVRPLNKPCFSCGTFPPCFALYRPGAERCTPDKNLLFLLQCVQIWAILKIDII